jgi:hypothetical protein
MDTDEKPSDVSLSSETETGHVEGGAICIVVGLSSTPISNRKSFKKGYDHQTDPEAHPNFL